MRLIEQVGDITGIEVANNLGFSPKDFVSEPSPHNRSMHIPVPEFPLGLICFRLKKAPSDEWLINMSEVFQAAVDMVGAYGTKCMHLDEQGISEFGELRREFYEGIGVDIVEVVDEAARQWTTQKDDFFDNLS